MASDRVLVVDDESAVRAALRRILEACGCEVEEAEGCGAAEAAVLLFSGRQISVFGEVRKAMDWLVAQDGAA